MFSHVAVAHSFLLINGTHMGKLKLFTYTPIDGY